MKKAPYFVFLTLFSLNTSSSQAGATLAQPSPSGSAGPTQLPLPADPISPTTHFVLYGREDGSTWLLDGMGGSAVITTPPRSTPSMAGRCG